jgi:hypothetical protein
MLSRLIRAEWRKLWSVRRWAIGLLGAGVVSVAISMLIASGSGVGGQEELVTVGPDGQPVSDDFHFVHQSLSGDGTITAQVHTQAQRDDGGRATDLQDQTMAGVMIKESTTSGAPYTALMTTPGRGVRMQANFTTDIVGSDESSPRWLRLAREGQVITGFESGDGNEWREVGSVTLDLPDAAEVGFFVASPPAVRIERQAGRTGSGEISTLGTATFADIALEPADGTSPKAWVDDAIGDGGSEGAAAEENGVFTVTGAGNIAENLPADDVVEISLIGMIIGSLAVIAVSALFVTSEYRRGMIYATFAAIPRRGRVLAAKSAVMAAATFAISLPASFAAFFLAQPILRDNGFAPPRFPEPSLSDPSVLRAVVGSAAILAMVAVLAVGVGMIVRRSAATIAVVTGLFFMPAFLATAMPPAPAEWLVRLTPASGLAMQRSLEPTRDLVQPWAMIPHWLGFGVLCLYAFAALAIAGWSLQRRDA